jgi:ABC-type uncharacterized transport system fused permease/ATPase subunit
MKLPIANKWLIAGLVTWLLLEAVLTGLIPTARGYLFEQLDHKSTLAWLGVGLYFANYLILTVVQSVKPWILLKVALVYRVIRTRQVTDTLSGTIDKVTVTNIPQRIQEDIKISYLARFTVWSEYLISGLILVQLIIMNLSVPLLVIASLVYAGVSVWIARKFNPKLTHAEITSQQEEATYRTSLVSNLWDLEPLFTANRAITKAETLRLQYSLFTNTQMALLIVLPFLVLLPAFLAGTLSLGEMMAHQATFDLIVVNAAILIAMYVRLVQGTASEKRVKELENE